MEPELFEEDRWQATTDLSQNDRFMEFLTKMNNICALGVSLNNRLYESSVSCQPSTNSAVSAKRAKVIPPSGSVSDHQSDIEALLANPERSHRNELKEHEKSSQNDKCRTDDKMANIGDPLLDKITQSLDEEGFRLRQADIYYKQTLKSQIK